MKNKIASAIAALTFLALSQQAKAVQVGLADWCVNNNGDIASACNGAGSGGNGISLASFDTTLENGSNNNTLGSVTVTATGSYVAFYADYDVDYNTLGSFQDAGSVSAAPTAGYSYEIADPSANNFGLFNDFSTGTLADTNTAGTYVGPPNVCCDVAFALAVGGLTSGEEVTFTVSTTNPGGFYIEQQNGVTGDAIYLSASLGGAPPPPPPGVPEPSTFALTAAFSLVGFGIAWKHKRAA